MDVRNGVLHLALFTAGSEFQIGICGANKHLMLPWQQWSKDVNKGRFGTSHLKIYLHARFEGGQKFSFPTLFDFYREVFLTFSIQVFNSDSTR